LRSRLSKGSRKCTVHSIIQRPVIRFACHYGLATIRVGCALRSTAWTIDPRRNLIRFHPNACLFTPKSNCWSKKQSFPFGLPRTINLVSHTSTTSGVTTERGTYSTFRRHVSSHNCRWEVNSNSATKGQVVCRMSMKLTMRWAGGSGWKWKVENPWYWGCWLAGGRWSKRRDLNIYVTYPSTLESSGLRQRKTSSDTNIGPFASNAWSLS